MTPYQDGQILRKTLAIPTQARRRSTGAHTHYQGSEKGTATMDNGWDFPISLNLRHSPQPNPGDLPERETEVPVTQSLSLCMHY